MNKSITSHTYLARRYAAMGEGLDVQVNRDGEGDTMTMTFGFGGRTISPMLLTRNDLVKLAGLVNVVLEDWPLV